MGAKLLLMSETLSENPLEKSFFDLINLKPSSLAYIPSKKIRKENIFKKYHHIF